MASDAAVMKGKPLAFAFYRQMQIYANTEIVNTKAKEEELKREGKAISGSEGVTKLAEITMVW